MKSTRAGYSRGTPVPRLTTVSPAQQAFDSRHHAQDRRHRVCRLPGAGPCHHGRVRACQQGSRHHPLRREPGIRSRRRHTQLLRGQRRLAALRPRARGHGPGQRLTQHGTCDAGAAALSAASIRARTARGQHLHGRFPPRRGGPARRAMRDHSLEPRARAAGTLSPRQGAGGPHLHARRQGLDRCWNCSRRPTACRRR
jgi:hypothetical protein